MDHSVKESHKGPGGGGVGHEVLQQLGRWGAGQPSPSLQSCCLLLLISKPPLPIMVPFILAFTEEIHIFIVRFFKGL